MTLAVYFAGACIGLTASASVGPVNILAISRSLRGGFRVGFATGLGAVAADSLVAGLSGLGLPWLANSVASHQGAIQLGGGLLLCLFGIVMMRTQPTLNRTGAEPAGGLLAAPVSAFVMTITNPGAILAIITVFGSLSGMASEVEGLGNVGLLVAGMVTGGTVWWAIISWGASRLRDRMTNAMLAAANRTAGLAVIAFGIALCGLGLARLKGWTTL